MSGPRVRADIFLAPGQLVVHRGPIRVKTIVGSCVAVCLWDVKRRAGGVNHYLLAQPTARDTPDNRFGTVAISTLVEKMIQAGVAACDLRAAVIGGGHPVRSMKPGIVGDDNTRVALDTLRQRTIRIVRQETGGDHGRKLLFNTLSGELIVRNLRGWSEVN